MLFLQKVKNNSFRTRKLDGTSITLQDKNKITCKDDVLDLLNN
jgi:hypothetical protein